MALLLATCGGWAQAQTPATPTPAATGELSPAERAKRDADKVFHWIMIHSDKPRKAKPEGKTDAHPEAKRDDRPAVAPTALRPSRPEGGAAPAAPANAAVAAAPKDGEHRKSDVAAQPVAANAGDAKAASVATAAPTGAPAAVDAVATQLASIPPSAAASEPASDDDDDATALVPVKQEAPEFPGGLMRQLRKGLVQVRFDVLPDGSVSKTEVVKTSNRRLNEIAMATVGQWRFQPLHKPKTATVELGFNLD